MEMYEDIVAVLQKESADEAIAQSDYEGAAAWLEQLGMTNWAAILHAIAADERRHYEQVQAIITDLQQRQMWPQG